MSEANNRYTVAERRLYRGVPTLFVNGQPIHGGGVVFRESPWGPPAFGAIDPEIAYIFTSHLFVGPEDELEIAATEQRLESVFREHPATLAGCIVSLLPSETWRRRYPKEMTVYDMPVRQVAPAGQEASWASSIWRRDSCDFVRRFAGRLREAFKGRIIVYQFGGGHCGENVPLVDPEGRGQWFCGDFSDPMTVFFRGWLRERYQNRLEVLQKAWSDPDVSFENASPPCRIERLRTEWYSLRSPLKSQTADFYRAWAETVEECILAWARTVKETTCGESLTASPIGSILDQGLNAFLIHHLMKGSLARVAQSGDLDFLGSPASYALRDPGRGDTSAMIPLGTVRLAQKIWLRDFDTHTCLDKRGQEHPVGQLWRWARDPSEDVQVLYRDAAYSQIKGGAYWWHEISDGMFRAPQYIAAARRMQQIGRAVLHADRSTPPGLAVLVDPSSSFHLASSNRLIYAMNYEARRLHWTHCGMAAETYCLDDVTHPDLPPHKVVMVTNAFAMQDAQADALRAFARRQQAVLIWLMAPGVQTAEGFDLRHASTITGFHIRAADVEANPRVIMAEGVHPWSKPPLPEGGVLTSFGAGPYGLDDSGSRGVGPLFFIEPEKNVTVLGLMDALGEPGLAVRCEDGVTNVWCGAPFLHNAILRQIGKDTGAHIYLDSDDLVHASAELFLINAQREGEKTIRWPRNAETVLDLISGAVHARNTLEWSLRVKEFDTRFIFAGPEATAAQMQKELCN